jgi:membrane protein DedA with SNARE-associated domain
VPGWLEGWPYVWIYLFFLSGAIMRSQALYWAGRGLSVGAHRTRLAGPLDAPRTRRGVQAIERWGMPVVPLSFLTVGFQSAVQGAAGLLGIRWLRYTLWCVPGWLAWALIWSAGGTAALSAGAALAARSPWALLAAVVLVTTVVGVVVRRRRTGPPAAAAAEVREA